MIEIKSKSKKIYYNLYKRVDMIRWDTVSYLRFYTKLYIFWDSLLICIINNFKFTSQYIGDKKHTLKPGMYTFFYY